MAPGSPAALAAMKSCDGNFARVLAELDAKSVRDKTDVFVVSDHGFSTVARAVDIMAELRKAGFSAVRAFKEQPRNGDVMVVASGGSTLIYAIGHDPELTGQLVKFFQKQDYTGVIFTRDRMEGTFTLEQGRINTPNAPDIVVSLRWSDAKSGFGLPGMTTIDGTAGDSSRGAHGSLSRYDMHNILIAAGIDFRHGVTNALPSGNADLAPTILDILGVQPPQPMDGRILFESTTVAVDLKRSPVEVRTLESSRFDEERAWRQYLRVTEFGGGYYLDEGNGVSQVMGGSGAPPSK
jgi:arylsulfatase A-like enzyme